LEKLREKFYQPEVKEEEEEDPFMKERREKLEKIKAN